MTRPDKPSYPIPVVGALTHLVRRWRAGLKRWRAQLSWSGTTSSTHPDENRAFLYFHFEDGRQQRLVCAPAQLDAFIAELEMCRSWMRGNNYAGMATKKPCQCGGAADGCAFCGGTGIKRADR